MTIVSVAPDSTQPIAQAVRNSNVDPIAASFDIKAYGKDSNSVVIDVTDFFRLDNQPVSLESGREKTIWSQWNFKRPFLYFLYPQLSLKYGSPFYKNI